MPMIVCVKCRKFFHPKKNGVAVEEGMPVRDEWRPYKLWQADLLTCRSCGDDIIAGFGMRPIAEHFHTNYGQLKERFNPIVFVEDCC